MSTHRYEIKAYLGDFADQVDDDQIEQLMQISDDINARYGADDPERDAAFAAAVQYVLGDTNADAAAREYKAAQLRRDETLAAAVQVADMAGLSEVAAAELIGISRTTVRRRRHGRNGLAERRDPIDDSAGREEEN